MPSVRTYKDAIHCLNTLQSNFATIEAIKKLGSSNKNQMSILEMYEWTRRIGYTPSDFNKLNIIHITGTKGKGSTCAFTQSILNQYAKQRNSPISKIGLYTSPHLRSVRERVSINGGPISEAKFAKYFFEVWDKLENSRSDAEKFPHLADNSKPAYFKFLTLLSFHAFVSEGVNSAIYEVGVGGQFDSTNIIEAPTATGVTALGIDHTFMLGDTLDQIAWNKGGIYKKSSPAFTVTQPLDALKVLEERATEKETKLKVVSQSKFPILDEIKLGLAGDFQKQNASLAIELAATHLKKLGYSIDTEQPLPEEFVVGLKEARWEGRCQTIELDEGNIVCYLDGAHTLESIEAGTTWFKGESAESKQKPKQRVLLFNQQNRDAALLVSKLHEILKGSVHFDHVIFTTNITWASGNYSDDLVSMSNSKKAIDELEVQNALAELWKGLSPASNIHVFHDIESGFKLVKTLEVPVEVFVTGSLHLVGGFLTVLDGTA